MLVRLIALILSGALLCSCGTYAPPIQEYGGDSQLLVQAIVTSVHCELTRAVQRLYAKAKDYPDAIPLAATMSNWGAQMALSLKTEEKSGLSPTVVWTPISPVTSIFTLGGSATISADAIKTANLNYYYTIDQLLKRGPCKTGVPPEKTVSSLLIQNDLDFGDWLFAQLAPTSTQELTLPTNPNTALKQNVLQYHIVFEVVTSGTLTPAWKLVRANVNQTGSFATAGRDRTHDLLITLGPGTSAGLKGAAKDSHLAQEIGMAIRNNTFNPSF
jgi:hypothetical protein